MNCLFLNNSLQWRHNGRGDVSNHQPRHCLLNPLFRRRSNKTSKLCVIGLGARWIPLTFPFPLCVRLALALYNALCIGSFFARFSYSISIVWRRNRQIQKKLVGFRPPHYPRIIPYKAITQYGCCVYVLIWYLQKVRCRASQALVILLIIPLKTNTRVI